MASTIDQVRIAERKYRQSMMEVMGKAGEIDVLREAFSSVVQAVMAADEEGWTRINALGEDTKGLSLEDVKKLTPWLESEVKKSGGLLGRALRLKTNHVAGRGFEFETTDNSAIQPRFRGIIDDPDNQAAVFSPSAIKRLNRILFTSGNLFIMYDEGQKVFSPLSIDLHIENRISYDDDPAKLKYILRQYTREDNLSGDAKREIVQEWIPTVNYKQHLRRTGGKLQDRLPVGVSGKYAPVRHDAVIIERRINNDNGDVWGVPDAFSAAPWAILYSNYLRDEAKVKNALAAISLVIKAKTKAAAQAANAQVQQARVGQAVITGLETEVESLPRAGSVDMYEGRPIAAMVAASLDVSTTGLTADPGPGGSYASENALTAPEQMAALSRQEDFRDIFSQIFRAMGAPKLTINWNRLDQDPLHRLGQTATMFRLNGGLNQQEYRNLGLEIMDIVPTETSLPEPDEWTGSKQQSLMNATLFDDPDPDGGLPSQGRSGSVGSLDAGGNDARNSDLSAGTA